MQVPHRRTHNPTPTTQPFHDALAFLAERAHAATPQETTREPIRGLHAVHATRKRLNPGGPWLPSSRKSARVGSNAFAASVSPHRAPAARRETETWDESAGAAGEAHSTRRVEYDRLYWQIIDVYV